MSRIGNKPIELPLNVNFCVSDCRVVTVKGPKGKLDFALPMGISADLEGDEIHVVSESKGRRARAMHGLARALISNMIRGASAGFYKELEIQGVGFKATVLNDNIRLNLGYSHDILYAIPHGVRIAIADSTKIRIEGVDRQLVGQVAADIRRFYPPEPYKGKGVRYLGERVIRKEGKSVQ